MIDWDADVLAPVMGVFGEGSPFDAASQPLYLPCTGEQPFRVPDAVFDRAYTDVSIVGDTVDASSRKPCLGVRQVWFSAQGPQQNDHVYIPSVDGTFIVMDVQPDGHGHIKLMLMGPTVVPSGVLSQIAASIPTGGGALDFSDALNSGLVPEL